MQELLTFVEEQKVGQDRYDEFKSLIENFPNSLKIIDVDKRIIKVDNDVLTAFYLDGLIEKSDFENNGVIKIDELCNDIYVLSTIISKSNKFKKLATDYDIMYEEKKHLFLGVYFVISLLIDKKYENINKIEDIVSHVPFSVLERVIINSKEDIKVEIERNGTIYTGVLEKIYNKFSLSGIQCIACIATKTILEGEFINTMQYITVPVNPVPKGLEDFGIKILTEDRIKEFNKRGKRVFELLKDIYFCKTETFGLVPGNWGLEKKYFNSRIIVDAEALKRENSSLYSAFFSFSKHKNTIENKDSFWMVQPEIPAFSLNDKQWFIAFVDAMEEIEFNDNAFNVLKIKEDYKELMLSMINNNIPSFDPISKKGLGKIFLLNGNPGIGKTLTAEAMAEYLHKPLYFASVGELGTSIDELEEALKRIIDLTKRWDAIVLIDEVDVFAQKRNSTNIENNAMTAIFLRMIERFEGIMFMTTNMQDNLDEAFVSRATLTLQYRDLTSKVKKGIFESTIKVIESEGITINLTEKYLNKLSTCRVNGRMIKNIMRLAYSLALKDKVLDADKIDTVLSLYNVEYGEEE